MDIFNPLKNFIIELVVGIIILWGAIALSEKTGLNIWVSAIMGIVVIIITLAILQYFNILDNILFPHRWSNKKKLQKAYEHSIFKAYGSTNIEYSAEGIVDMMRLKSTIETQNKEKKNE